MEKSAFHVLKFLHGVCCDYKKTRCTCAVGQSRATDDRQVYLVLTQQAVLHLVNCFYLYRKDQFAAVSVDRYNCGASLTEPDTPINSLSDLAAFTHLLGLVNLVHNLGLLDLEIVKWKKFDKLLKQQSQDLWAAVFFDECIYNAFRKLPFLHKRVKKILRAVI